MNSWLSSSSFASVLSSSSALTPEECKPSVSPISSADPSVIHGQVNFLAAFTDQDFIRSMSKITDSSWVNITGSSASNNQVLMHERNKINGTCVKYNVKMNIEDNTFAISSLNMTAKGNMLPSCDGCLVFMINGNATNVKSLLRFMKVDDSGFPDQISFRSSYFLGKGQTMTESDSEHFKKQASCLSFSEELDYLYNPEKGFCSDEESIPMPFA